ASATTASPAPAAKAAATNSCPSRASPRMAKNASPRPMVRLSMEMPETASGSGPTGSACIAAAMALVLHGAMSLIQASAPVVSLAARSDRNLRGRQQGDDFTGFLVLIDAETHGHLSR